MRAWVVALAVSCPVAALAQPVDPSSGSCSIVAQNLAVRDVLQDVYFWYQNLPDPDPAAFPSPESYLEAVRFRPFDATFSFINTRADDEAFFGRSQFVGFGFSMSLRDGRVIVTEVFPNGPAAEAGWQRGHELLTLNGESAGSLARAGTLDQALAGNVGHTVRFEWRDATGAVATTSLSKRVVTIPTVSAVASFEREGRRIGYFVLRNFVETTAAALDDVFARFREERVDDVVIDVRYNGGGLVAVAQHLTGLIGGTHTAHQVFAELTHSDRLRARDRVLRFPTPPRALGASRLVVITTRSSASASELLINSLRPFMPVYTVGARTLGKPVGQYGIGFCAKVLHPVAFVVRDARRQPGPFEGIPADCPAADDVTRGLGDPREASLEAALDLLANGRCVVAPSPSPAGTAAAVGPTPPRFHAQTTDLSGSNYKDGSLPRQVEPTFGGWNAFINAW